MHDDSQRSKRTAHGSGRRPARWLVLLAGLGASLTMAIAAMVIGAWYYVEPGLPEAETIRDIPLQIPLRIYSRDGRLIEEVGERRRILVSFDDLQPFVVDAFVAAEDRRFFSHPGVDLQGILRAGVNLLRSGSIQGGGSTITQQLARDYFLTRETLFTRKLREAFLAYKIEQEFTKQEIMALFLNKMFFGQRAYGVAAAAQVYFGKNLKDITIAEAATLAGVLPAPSRYNPVRSPANARMRRNYVLSRMLQLDYIDRATFDEAMGETLVSQLHGTATELSAPYVAEMVRQEMLKRYGESAYSAGYRVVTTIDSRMQRGANYALRNGLLEFTRRRGYRGPIGKIEVDAATLAMPFVEWPEDVQLALDGYTGPGGLVVAIVTALHDDNSAAVVLQDGSKANLPWYTISWARPRIDRETLGPTPTAVDQVLAPGDLVYVMRLKAGGWALAQAPEAQSAVVSLDPKDGAITSLVGGFDYSLSKFNRVTQASRQPGSSFKPFIYSAALEHGNTPATVLLDAPVVISSSELEAVWRPVNYSGRFYGEQRMREALVRSMNLASVRLLLNNTGVSNAIRHIEPFGFGPAALPHNGSLALGGGNASPLDMAQGYAVFANGGFAVKPYVIDSIFGPEDEELYRAEPPVACLSCEAAATELPATTDTGDGTPEEAAVDLAAEMRVDSAYRAPPEPVVTTDTHLCQPAFGPGAPALPRDARLAPRIIPVQNAYLIQDMMRDVIQRGTGRRARVLGRGDLSGKTGTSNDRRDAWFAGFNGDMSAIVWVGYDEDEPLGPSEEGSKTALPIWIQFARAALAGAPENRMPMPEGIVTVRISRRTGCPATASDPSGDVMFEIFREGHVPACEQSDGQMDIFNLDEDNSPQPAPDDDDEPLF